MRPQRVPAALATHQRGGGEGRSGGCGAAAPGGSSAVGRGFGGGRTRGVTATGSGREKRGPVPGGWR